MTLSKKQQSMRFNKWDLINENKRTNSQTTWRASFYYFKYEMYWPCLKVTCANRSMFLPSAWYKQANNMTVVWIHNIISTLNFKTTRGHEQTQLTDMLRQIVVQGEILSRNSIDMLKGASKIISRFAPRKPLISPSQSSFFRWLSLWASCHYFSISTHRFSFSRRATTFLPELYINQQVEMLSKLRAQDKGINGLIKSILLPISDFSF